MNHNQNQIIDAGWNARKRGEEREMPTAIEADYNQSHSAELLLSMVDLFSSNRSNLVEQNELKRSKFQHCRMYWGSFQR